MPTTAEDAQQLWLMVEGHTARAMSEASHMMPVFEFDGQWDGGKAETAVGAKLGGGFEYAHTQIAITVRWRYLLVHQKFAFDE